MGPSWVASNSHTQLGQGVQAAAQRCVDAGVAHHGLAVVAVGEDGILGHQQRLLAGHGLALCAALVCRCARRGRAEHGSLAEHGAPLVEDPAQNNLTWIALDAV